MAFEEYHDWLQNGQDKGFASPMFCDTHEGYYIDEPIEEDACLFSVRLLVEKFQLPECAPSNDTPYTLGFKAGLAFAERIAQEAALARELGEEGLQ